jgi:hypothetical protein
MLAIAKCTVLALLVSSAVLGQEDQFILAPYLRPDGSKPPDQENRFVFLLPSSGDAVVIYPRIREDGSSDPNDVIKVQVKLCRHVEPSIVSQVAQEPSTGTFEYSYILENGKGTRQSAWRWLFEYVTDSGSINVSAPVNWSYQFPKVKAGQMPVPANVEERNLLFRALQVFASDGSGSPRPNLGVPPGGRLPGLTLRTRRRPGLLNVYVQGGMAIPSFPEEPPEEASAEIGTVIRSLYNYRHTFCYGPRFEETADTSTVAQAFAGDLDRLISSKALEPASAFVATGKALLRSLSSKNAGFDLALIKAWAASAKTDNGRQFAQMLLLALRQT